MDQLPFDFDPQAPASKREVLKAALDLFVRKGLCETTVRDIAAASGYTNPVIFKYFATKEALAFYLYEQCYLKLHAELSAAIRSGTTFREKLQRLIGSYAEIVDENPTLFLYVQENIRTFWPKMPEASRQRSILRLVRDLFREGVREGVVRPEAEVRLLVAAFSGFLSQFARMVYFDEFPGGAREWAARLEQTVRWMVEG